MALQWVDASTVDCISTKEAGSTSVESVFPFNDQAVYVDDPHSGSGSSTPKQGTCASEFVSVVSSPVQRAVTSMNQPCGVTKDNDNLRDNSRRYARLIESSRSPITWPGKNTPEPKINPMRPAFVYCGPGTRRVPGFSGQSYTTSKSGQASSQLEVGSVNSSTTKLLRPSSAVRCPQTRSGQVKLSPRPVNIMEEQGIMVTTPCQKQKAAGADGSGPTIQALGDAALRKSPSTATRRNIRKPIDSSLFLRQNRSSTSSHSTNLFQLAMWRGPEFVLERISNWTFETKLLDAVPSSDDVHLSGLILQPATYIRAKDDAMKHILLEADCLFGTIRVHNHAYEKSITIRASSDKWLSYVDKPAVYIPSLEESESSKVKRDTFAFRFTLHETSDEFEFAVHYRWWTPNGGGSTWDNNNGQNYIIRRFKDLSTAPVEPNKPEVAVSEVADAVPVE